MSKRSINGCGDGDGDCGSKAEAKRDDSEVNRSRTISLETLKRARDSLIDDGTPYHQHKYFSTIREPAKREEKDSLGNSNTTGTNTVINTRSSTSKYPRRLYNTRTSNNINKTNKNPSFNNLKSIKKNHVSPIRLFCTNLDKEELQTSPMTPLRDYCLTLRQMLGLDPGPYANNTSTKTSTIQWLIITTYLIDFQYLIDEIPELLSIPKLIVFYGHNTTSSNNNYHNGTTNAQSQATPEERWKQACTRPDGTCTVDFRQLDPGGPPRSPTNPLGTVIRFGVHHTKMFIMGLQDNNHNHDDNDDTNVQQTRKLRLIIHTSNLQRNDLEQKAQGAYIEEFPFQSSDPDSAKPRKNTNRTCDFKNDLVSYIETYKYNKTHQWWWNGGDHGEQQRKLVDEIRRYDFSKTRAVLIFSTPGWYSYSDRPRGYLKLSKAIRDHYSSNNNSDASTNSSSTTTTRASRQEGRNNSTTTTTTTTTPIVCQFSSIGSLNQKWLQDFAESLDTAQNKCRNLTDEVLRLVYPTSEEIRSSVEGYVGGTSVPGTAKNVEKSILKPLFCRWAGAKTDHHHRGRRCHPLHKPSNVPHIKTYYQLTEDGQGMKWFCLTSHNLSKAAWGEKQNTKFGAKLMMRHWELGVVIFPVGGPKQKLVSVATATATTTTTVTKTTGNADEEHCNEDSLSANEIPLPFQIHPTAYGISDLPWAVDRVYKEPDKYGRRSIQG